jgi:hypothetical protein
MTARSQCKAAGEETFKFWVPRAATGKAAHEGRPVEMGQRMRRDIAKCADVIDKAGLMKQ